MFIYERIYLLLLRIIEYIPDLLPHTVCNKKTFLDFVGNENLANIFTFL